MNYRHVETGDGTLSIYSEEFKEQMHTVHGAYTESIEKHIVPSGLVERANRDVKILDVGFGMGYNVLASIVEFRKFNSRETLEIISLEKDNSFIDLLKEVKFDGEKQQIYDNIVEAFETGVSVYENCTIKIMFGDARKNIKELSYKKQKFDIIFQDAFSPGKNSELWTLDYFKLLYELIEDDGIMTTYSAAFQVRRAMIEAGFFIGSFFPEKTVKQGTIAKKQNFDLSLTKRERTELFAEIKSEPYRDPDFSLSREEIFQNRLKRVCEIRESKKNKA